VENFVLNNIINSSVWCGWCVSPKYRHFISERERERERVCVRVMYVCMYISKLKKVSREKCDTNFVGFLLNFQKSANHFDRLRNTESGIEIDIIYGIGG
jgi:hypothetical protein